MTYHHGVHKGGLASGEHGRSFVDQLCALAISTQRQLRVRTLTLCLSDEFGHGLGARCIAASIESLDIGRVIDLRLGQPLSRREKACTYTLNRHLIRRSHAYDGLKEGRAGDSPDVALFESAAGKDDGQRSTRRAVHELVVGVIVGVLPLHDRGGEGQSGKNAEREYRERLHVERWCRWGPVESRQGRQ